MCKSAKIHTFERAKTYPMKKTILLLVLLTGMLFHGYGRERVDGDVNDYKNSVKLTFLSWISGSTKLSYERALPKIRQSSELCASVIGAGRDKYQNDPKGFTVRYGHKFFFRDHDEKSLQGWYLRPEAIYSYYNYDCNSSGNRELADMGALLGTAGYQFVYNRFLADFWVGAGYAFGHPSETRYHHGFELWHWLGKTNDHLAMSFSIRLGLCF